MSPAVEKSHLVREWFRIAKLPHDPATKDVLGRGQPHTAKEIENRLGADVWTEFSPAEVAETVDVPALILHGAKDRYVPPDNAEIIHSHWRDSTVELIDGVDHFDILGSPKARESISAFL